MVGGTKEPKVVIGGPFKDSGKVDAPDVKLYSTEELRTGTESDLRNQNVPGQGSGENLLAGFTSKEEYNASGVITADRIYNSNNYNKNRVQNKTDALVDWIVRLESLCHSNQRKGYRLRDYMRGDPRDLNPDDDDAGVLVNDVSWTYEAGAPHEVQWELGAKIAGGTSTDFEHTRSDYINTSWNNKRNKANLRDKVINSRVGQGEDSFDLGEITTKRVNREVELNVEEIMKSGPEGNEGLILSSPVMTFNLTGSVTDKDMKENSSLTNGSASLESFCTEIQKEWMGKDRVVKYIDSFTQRTFEGQISSFETTWTWGTNRRVEFTMEFMEGRSHG